jgi:hypothetical protein
MFDKGKPHGYGSVNNNNNAIKCNYYWRNGKIIKYNNGNEFIPLHNVTD